MQESLIAGLNPKKLDKLKILDKNMVIKRNEQFTKLFQNNTTNNNKKKRNENLEKKNPKYF